MQRMVVSNLIQIHEDIPQHGPKFVFWLIDSFFSLKRHQLY